MKRPAVFFGLLLIPFVMMNFSNSNFDFEKEWKEIQNLENKGKYDSALAKVNEILDISKRLTQTDQHSKALVYKAKLTGYLSENRLQSTIEYLEDNYQQVNLEYLPLYCVYLAKAYSTLSFEASISSKEQKSALERCFEYLRKAIENESTLENSIEKYVIFVESGRIDENLALSLYDIVVREIGNINGRHLENDLEIALNDLIAEPSKFLNTSISEKQSSFLWRLYQNYERFLRDSNKEVLLTVQFTNRLGLLRAYNPTKENIQEVVEAYYALLTSDDAKVLILSRFQNDLDNTYDRIRALYLKDQLSEYTKLIALQAIQAYESPSLSIEMDWVFAAERPPFNVIKSKNIAKVLYTIYELDIEQFLRFNRAYQIQEKRKILGKSRELRRGSLELKDTTQILALDRLGYGKYVIQFEPEAIPNLVTAPRMEPSFGLFQISDISLSMIGSIDKDQYLVRNFWTGDQLPGLSVNQYLIKSDEIIQLKTVNTDDEGCFYPQLDNQGTNHFVVNNEKDQYVSSQFYSNRLHTPREFNQTNILLDRAIYKPGDEVKFAGILFRRNSTGDPSTLIKSDKPILVRLKNQQGQLIEEKQIKSNEFGKFTGAFDLPEGGLLGQYWINVMLDKRQIGGVPLKVEEFKAPNFNVELSEKVITKNQRDISILALAQAGFPVVSATAKVSLYRTQYPFYRHSFGMQNSEEYISDTTVYTGTDGTANAIINLPDKQSKTYWESYRIKVTLTDAKGETVEQNLVLNGSSSGQNIMDWSDWSKLDDVNELAPVRLLLKNSNEEPVEKSGTIGISRIQEFLGNNKEQISLDQYELLGNPSAKDGFNSFYMSNNSMSRTILLEGNIQTSESIDLSEIIQNAGMYEVVFDTDEASYKHSFVINDYENCQSVINDPLMIKINQQKALLGQEIKLTICPKFNQSVPLRILKIHSTRVSSTEFLNVNDRNVITHLIQEKDRGGFLLKLDYVYRGKPYTKDYHIEVPFENKKIHVDITDWPKNAPPNSLQKIGLELKDHFGRPVASDISISIFNSKLEALAEHNWFDNYFPQKSSRVHHQVSHSGYSQTQSNVADFKGRKSLSLLYEYQYSKLINILGLYGFRSRYIDEVQVSAQSAGVKSRAMGKENLEAQFDMDSNGFGSKQQSETAKQFVSTDFTSLVHFEASLKSDKNGRASLEFKVPNELSEWTVLVHAHDKNLAFHYDKRQFKTYQEIYSETNWPRFTSYQDDLNLKTQLINQSKKPQELVAVLSKLSGAQVVPISEESITLKAGEQKTIEFADVSINEFEAQNFRMSIRDKNSDKIIHTIDKQIVVRSKKQDLVKSFPLDIKSGGIEIKISEYLNQLDPNAKIKTIGLELVLDPFFDILLSIAESYSKDGKNSIDLSHQLAYMKLLDHFLTKSPRLKTWLNDERNIELIENMDDLLNEFRVSSSSATPWSVQLDSDKNNRISLSKLTDSEYIALEINRFKNLLGDMQNSDGGFSWYPKGRSNLYASLTVAENLSRLERLNEINHGIDLNPTLEFIGNELAKLNYEKKLDNHRSFWVAYELLVKSIENATRNDRIEKIDLEQCLSELMSFNITTQAKLALLANLSANRTVADEIKESLLERSFLDDEVGRFWKLENAYSWSSWTMNAHSYLAELFAVENSENKLIGSEMRRWILTSLRSQRWGDAQSGYDGLLALVYLTASYENNNATSIKINGVEKNDRALKNCPYYLEFVQSTDRIRLNDVSQRAYGHILVRYEMDSDQVKKEEKNPILNISRKYYKIIADSMIELSGEKLYANVGDRIKVQLEIESDRNMDFVAVIDQRSSGMEPSVKLSGYRYNKLAYYSANYASNQSFFIDRLNRGINFIEYEVILEQSGNLSGGVPIIQSIYAPEYTDHGEHVNYIIE